MDKLKLKLEMLEVQTFDTMAEAIPQPGTVFGMETNNHVEDSCFATFCTDCQNTQDAGCDVENTNNCQSVNVAWCQSAWYTECQCGGTNLDCGDSAYDPWKWNCS